MNQTQFDKIWWDQVVTKFDDGSYLLYINRIFLRERTGSVALPNEEPYWFTHDAALPKGFPHVGT